MADEPLRSSVADDAGSLLAALRDAAATPPRDRDAEGELAPGTVIGEHFVIEASLGRGGMGAVYRARDRRLDRAVALKVNLRGADLTRARREAVALARLAHPNVVTIHEIGEHGGAPFVAMELCDGGNARAWVRAAKRTWREVLAVYLDAGRGLAAAHAAGLVHRDVKPDNILLGGDGRVRIGDFGLARDAAGLTGAGRASVTTTAVTTASPGPTTIETGASHRAPIDSDAHDTAHAPTTPGGPLAAAANPTPAGRSFSDPGDAVTAAGAIVGTPRYMAPEQLGIGTVDARADQFAFCVALSEALGGLPPLPLPAERAVAVAEGRAAPAPRPRHVPRRVHAVLAHGLRAAPDARWPSMDALCRALARAQRRRWPIAAAAVILLAAIALAIAIVRPRAPRAPADPCAGIPADLSAIWTPTSRAAFIARHPSLATTAAWAAGAIDHDVATWNAARIAACRDLPRSASWSPRIARSAARCLSVDRDALVQLIGVTASSAGALVADVEDLIDPAGCADDVKLNGTPEVNWLDLPLAIRLDYVRQLGAQSDHADAAGDEAGALALAQEASRIAHQGDDTLLAAIGDFTLGRVLLKQRGLAAGGPELRRAFFGFRETSDASETAMIAVKLSSAYLEVGQLDLADEWLDHARAESIRVHSAAVNRANVDELGARIAEARGKYDDALAINAGVIASLEALHDPRADVSLGGVLSDRAMALAEAGRTAESIEVARRSLALEERIVGRDHPDLLPDLGNLGLSLVDIGEIDEAIQVLGRARAIGDASLPHDAVSRAYGLWNYAVALGKRDPAAAGPVFDEAIDILARKLGPDHPDTKQAKADRAAAMAAPK